MAKNNYESIKNGAMWKLIIWILTLAFAAGSLCMTIKSNRDRIEDVSKVTSARLASVEATATENREATIGIKKDIQRLNEKVGEVNISQEKLRSEQKEAFKEIFKRLP